MTNAPPDDQTKAPAPVAGGAEADRPRSREERRRARNKRGFRARPQGRGTAPALDPLAPPPLVALEPPPAPSATGDEVADLLLERLGDPEEPAAPLPSGLFGRPIWHWALLAGISVAVGALVASLTGDGPLVLSSAAATAMGGGSFMALFKPPAPGLPAGRAPATAPPAVALPSVAPEAPPPPPRANRAARRAPASAATASSEAAKGPRAARPRGPKDLR